MRSHLRHMTHEIEASQQAPRQLYILESDEYNAYPKNVIHAEMSTFSPSR